PNPARRPHRDATQSSHHAGGRGRATDKSIPLHPPVQQARDGHRHRHPTGPGTPPPSGLPCVPHGLHEPAAAAVRGGRRRVGRRRQQEGAEALHHHQVARELDGAGARQVPRGPAAIRSHAQKYFLKVQKNGTSEHVPPPRPKRKAAHPYPQKASKNESGYALKTDPSAMLRNSGMNVAVSPWTHNSIPPVVASSFMKDLGAGSMGPNIFCSSSSEGPPRAWQSGETNDQINQVPSLRIMPDFAQVYSFLGSVFDPSTKGHLQKLKEMNPIDVETALLLMRNLSINLTSPDFEDQRKLLSSYNSTSDGLELGSSRSSLLTDNALSLF
uniref:MYB-related protein n=2 Tax=Triticinae TaxID=1648030 RepID=A0A8R7QPX3_TRIUA